MGILLGLTPFILFFLLTTISVSLALWLSFAAAFALSIRDFLYEKTLRLLDVACLGLFALMAIYVGFVMPGLNVPAVRLIAEAGLFFAAVISMAMRRPLLLQYAREQVPESLWTTARLSRAAYILTAVWAVAFAVMAAIDGAAAFNREFPLSLDLAVGLLALVLAVAITVRYPLGTSPPLKRQAP